MVNGVRRRRMGAVVSCELQIGASIQSRHCKFDNVCFGALGMRNRISVCDDDDLTI